MPLACSAPALDAAASCSGVMSVSFAHAVTDASTYSLRSSPSIWATNCFASSTSAASGSTAGCLSAGGGSGSVGLLPVWGPSLGGRTTGSGFDEPHAAARIRSTGRGLRTGRIYIDRPGMSGSDPGLTAAAHLRAAHQAHRATAVRAVRRAVGARGVAGAARLQLDAARAAVGAGGGHAGGGLRLVLVREIEEELLWIDRDPIAVLVDP